MDAATVYDLVRDLHIGADLVFVFGLLAGLFMLAALSFHAEAALRKERRLVAAMLRVNRVVTGTALIVVWACGAWLPLLFPEHAAIALSRREVFFLGGDARWQGTPGFCDFDGTFYGHGDVGGLGVKFGPDFPGEPVDPDTLDRVPSKAGVRAAREYAAHRFPALADAPVLGGRVCQYALTVDTHFLVAPHPERSNWWLIGGGSGHGFKHGPALGDYVADCVEGAREPEPFHALGARTGAAGLRSAAVG